MVETESEAILKDADTEDVAFLVVGDPFGWAYLFNTGSLLLPRLTFPLQCHNTHRFGPESCRSEDPIYRHPQRQHNECRRSLRPGTLQFRTNYLYTVLHRLVASIFVASKSRGERPPWTAYACITGYQGERAERDEPCSVRSCRFCRLLRPFCSS